MSVVIIGGNERMERRYKDICKEYNCDSKVFTKMNTGLPAGIGSPDLLIFFTGTMSHKMLHFAMKEICGEDTVVVHAKSGSVSTLRHILQKSTG